jgi:hypothetical protein
MRVLFAVLARFHAEQPGVFDASITAGEDMVPVWEAAMRVVREHWRRAVSARTTAELADAMRAKLSVVHRAGGKQPLLAATAVALLCEVGELARNDSNDTCLCWVDMDTGTLVAAGATGGPGWRRTLMETATRLGCRLEVRPVAP